MSQNIHVILWTQCRYV